MVSMTENKMFMIIGNRISIVIGKRVSIVIGKIIQSMITSIILVIMKYKKYKIIIFIRQRIQNIMNLETQ